MNNVYYVGSGDLTFELIERIINENLKLELAPEARLRIQRCRDYLDRKIAESDVPLYGITTGFGSLCNKNISPDELGTLQENLIKSHACSVGEEIKPGPRPVAGAQRCAGHHRAAHPRLLQQRRHAHRL